MTVAMSICSFRNNLQRCSVKNSQNSQESTCACNFFNKETLAQVFSCEFCGISKNILSLKNTSGGCLCTLRKSISKYGFFEITYIKEIYLMQGTSVSISDNFCFFECKLNRWKYIILRKYKKCYVPSKCSSLYGYIF